MPTDQQVKVARLFASGEPTARAGLFGPDLYQALARGETWMPNLGNAGVAPPKDYPFGFPSREAAIAYARKIQIETIAWAKANCVTLEMVAAQ
ncbi:hypothetical protein V5F40_22820 [Xanthobacter sp. DSM 14520]|uniref:hypothetical protein n=1 Tax=Xanthobacter autotrophicus (strain ATCC BAA-1158 / Py2) TaxID=78245 RepID=UPI0037270FF0